MPAYAKLAARLRVPSGFLVAVLFLVLSRPTRESLGAGLPLAAAGLLLRAWAAGHLAKNQELATTGPFAYTRNPLYLGTLIVATGLSVAGQSWATALFLALYFLVFYFPVIQEEESHLRHLFPEYAAYAAGVPRLWPRLTPARSCPRSFRWALYLRNREYQALLGYLVAIAVLIAKLPG